MSLSSGAPERPRLSGGMLVLGGWLAERGMVLKNLRYPLKACDPLERGEGAAVVSALRGEKKMY
jgi:hypothetical protein